MIVNICDWRDRPHRFLNIFAVVEDAFRDNSVSDQVLERSGPDCEEPGGITLAQAIAWANSFCDPVTLFLCDGRTLQTCGHDDLLTPCADVQKVA
jgi:hypothetical protein